MIKIHNKGWYVARFKLIYQDESDPSKNKTLESTIIFGQVHVFNVTDLASFDSQYGVRLKGEVVAGNKRNYLQSYSYGDLNPQVISFVKARRLWMLGFRTARNAFILGELACTHDGARCLAGDLFLPSQLTNFSRLHLS